MIEYSPDFKFKEGIYMSIDDFKNNKPIVKSRILSKIEANDMEYFAKILSNENIQFYDDYGILQTVKISDVWGYCRKGMASINWQGEFSRIPVIGNICFFAAIVRVSGARFADPFDPYSSGMVANDAPQEESRQYLIDFETGQILDFYYTTVEELLKRDPELYSEFKALKKRKKKQMAFLYIRKYNERHPISFPQ